jgi:hypothetical protein
MTFRPVETQETAGTTLEVNETPETVLSRAEEFCHGAEWTRGATIGRPLTSQNTHVQVFTMHSFFPQTVAGWLVNLALIAVTFGLWLAPYILYKFVRSGDARYALTLRAFPSPSGGSRVNLESNRDDWLKPTEEWIRNAFTGTGVEEETVT